MLILFSAIALLSHQRTQGSTYRLAKLNLYGENIIEKPAGWLPPDIARADFLAVWCKREDVTDCKELGDLEAVFDNEWKTRRTSALADMRRPNWTKSGSQKYDLRDSDLSRAFLSGADLSAAQMEGADLSEAQMEGAMLHYAILTGTQNDLSVLEGTNLSMAINNGGMLRFVDLTPAVFDPATDFRNAFFDQTVEMTETFRSQMGDLCQIIKEPLQDAMFYARWRGWIEAGPDDVRWEFMVVPDEYQDVPPIPPSSGCEWKTGPMPASAPE